MKKQKVLYFAKKTKKKQKENVLINKDFSKDIVDMRREKCQTLKKLINLGAYAISVHDKVITSGKFLIIYILYIILYNEYNTI